MKRLACLLLICMPWFAVADPDVRIQSRLLPEGDPLVGATVSLEVDLLVDTWYTAAPVLAKLELADAVVTPPTGEAEHLNQKIDGKTFFGLRYTYQITAQAARQFTIPALPFVVQPGQGSGPVTLTSQPLSFTARALAGGGSQQQLVARNVTFTQVLQRSHEPLRVGDSITRQLTLQAEGAQAMLMPAPQFVEVEGFKRYLQPPAVKALNDGRGGTSGGVREDTATYVVTRAGPLSLPAIELKWWDYAGQAHSVAVEAVSIDTVQAQYNTPFSISDDLRALGQQAQIRLSAHWLLLVVVLVTLAVLAILGRRWWRPLRDSLRAWQNKRRSERLASADYAWKQLGKQLHSQPPRLDALYLWVRRSSGKRTLRTFYELFSDAADFRSLDLLETRYSRASASAEVPVGLLKNLGQLRQRLKRNSATDARKGLKPLNP